MSEGEEVVSTTVPLPRGELSMLQPQAAADLPDDHEFQWAPLAPYWSVVWRSGVALAGELEMLDLRGREIVELGCGLGIPSIAAARAGAEVLATDIETEALDLVARNSAANAAPLGTMRVDWENPGDLIDRGPFDTVVAADVLYEMEAVLPLLDLLPVLAPDAWVATPARAPADSFLAQVDPHVVESYDRGVIQVVRLDFS